MKNNTSSESKKKYKQIMQIVKEVIDQWDPFKLLPLAPQDEYDSETEIITATIRENMCEEDLAKEIQSIFIERFSSDAFFINIDDCRKVARIIKLKLESMIYNK